MMNFEVSDIDKSVGEVSSKGVKVIAEKYHIKATVILRLSKISMKYFQLVQVRMCIVLVNAPGALRYRFSFCRKGFDSWQALSVSAIVLGILNILFDRSCKF